MCCQMDHLSCQIWTLCSLLIRKLKLRVVKKILLIKFSTHHSYCLVNTFNVEINDTHEIAIICYEDFLAIEDSMMMFAVKAIMMIISVFFILLTLYIYYLLPELRETQDKVTIFTLMNLATFLFFLAILQTDHPSDQLGHHCVYLSYFVFFFSLAYFSWLNCTLANVWKIIV